MKVRIFKWIRPRLLISEFVDTIYNYGSYSIYNYPNKGNLKERIDHGCDFPYWLENKMNWKEVNKDYCKIP